jgi:glycosyltransferase involved in cell wall biosynthesis
MSEQKQSSDLRAISTQNPLSNERPLVTVFNWSYNHCEFIRKSIDSILSQKTNFPVEVIIHDDASTDGSKEILKEYENKYPNIFQNIIHEKNQWNQGKSVMTPMLEVPRGEYVALTHGDDYWTDPMKLQKQICLLRANPSASFCFHNTFIVNSNMEVSGQLRPQNPSLIHSIEELFGHNFIHTSSIVYRKSMLPEFPDWYCNAPMGDWPLCILLAEKGKFLYIDEVMSHYRLHEQSSWSSQSQAIRCAKTVHLFDLLKGHFAKKIDLLDKVNKGFIMHSLNAAKEFKNLNDTENVDLFNKKVVEVLTEIKVSERVQDWYPEQSFQQAEIMSKQIVEGELDIFIIKDQTNVNVCMPACNREEYIADPRRTAISGITISDALTGFAEGRLSDAEAICRHILGKDERCGGAWHLMGKMAALQGDLETAGMFASAACELDSQNAEFIRDLADVFLRKKEVELAEHYARRALELLPGSLEGLILLGRIFAEKDDKP